MAMLQYLVLPTTHVHEVVRFYTALGFTFVSEQHGTTQLHYAAKDGNLVIEVYPSTNPEPAGGIMLGIVVPSVMGVLTNLQTIGPI
ncbi:MAG TPA: VOC family protein, partial [Candidatus Kapabacteria bacterium]|nr:VOC family protein [Candidatus Kapabacteria bacterium]